MMSLHREYNEKRDFIRMKIDTQAHLIVPGKDQPISGICRDLSGGGMLLETNIHIPIGTQAEVAITSSYGHEPMLHVMAKVTRIASNSQQDLCLLGLQIDTILT